MNSTTTSQIQRDSVLARAHTLLNKPNFTKEDASRVESLLGLADQLAAEPGLSRLRRSRLTEIELDLGERTERTRAVETVRQDFLQALRFGKDSLPDERRALAVGTDAAGGYLVPQSFADQVFVAMKGYDPLFDESVVTVIETVNGNACPVPLADDTSASATVIGENAQLNTATDVTFDQLLLAKASSWKTSMVKVSLELLQDSGFDIETLLASAFAVRLARGIGASFYTTLIGAATKGVDAGASAITPDNLFDLLDSVDEAYLASPKCGWLMRRSTLTYLRKLKDTSGASYFPLDRDANGRFLLLDFPVHIAPSVAAIGTGNKSVAFGDLSYFVSRRVRDSVKVRPFRETYAENAQVGFCAYVRANAGLAKASTADSPVKYLLHA